MSFEEDLTVFFNDNDFADYAIKSDNSKIVGILDIEPIELNGFVSNEPTFLIKNSDSSKLSRGTVVTINSSTYTVKNSVRQDEKLTKLVLMNGS